MSGIEVMRAIKNYMKGGKIMKSKIKIGCCSVSIPAIVEQAEVKIDSVSI